MSRLILGVVAVAIAAGGFFLVRDGRDDPRKVVEHLASAYPEGDCETAADLFHYEEAADRASEVAISQEAQPC